MVIALAGRRVDACESPNRQFPLENVPLVRERLRDFFASHPVTALVASAACGADLLALDEAASRSIPRRIVLPFEASRFRETSVADRPGDWGPLYDRILAQCGDVVVLPSAKLARGENAYAGANAAILDEAATFAGQSHDAVTALLVWNGVSNGKSDLTQAFGEEARRRGLAVADISTCDRV